MRIVLHRPLVHVIALSVKGVKRLVHGKILVTYLKKKIIFNQQFNQTSPNLVRSTPK